MNYYWPALKHMTDFSFEELKLYLETVEIALSNEKNRFETWVDSKIKGLDEDKADELGELYAEDHQQLSETFPALARKSAFLTIYSTFEYSLLNLCERTKREKKQDFGPRDIKGEFSGARKFLDRVTGIKMYSHIDWEKVNNLRKVRNLIVHEGGVIKLSDEKSKTLIRTVPRVSINHLGLIVFEEEFCLIAIDLLRDFFNYLYAEVTNHLAT